jgi:hypothetical protein
MKYLKKLRHSQHKAPGLERVIIKRLPVILLGGTLIPLFVSIVSRFFPPVGSATQIGLHLMRVDILSIASVLTLWMIAIPVAICYIMVILMKGPAYAADAYPLSDSEKPLTDEV